MASLIRYKIHLILFAESLAVLICCTILYHTDIDLETTYFQFIIYDILHNMVFLLLPEIKNGITHTHIREIIL